MADSSRIGGESHAQAWLDGCVISLVTSGVPFAGGGLFAAEGVALAEGKPGFDRTWSQRTCPQAIRTAALAAPRERRIQKSAINAQDKARLELPREFLDWIAGRPCWTLDSARVKPWIEAAAKHCGVKAPPVLDIALFAWTIAPEIGGAGPGAVMSDLAMNKRACPTDLYRAPEGRDAISAIVKEFRSRASSVPDWGRLVLRLLDSAHDTQLGMHAKAARELLLHFERDLFDSGGKLKESFRNDEVISLLATAITNAGPTYMSVHSTTPRPNATGLELSKEKMRHTVEEIFRVGVPSYFSGGAQGGSKSQLSPVERAKLLKSVARPTQLEMATEVTDTFENHGVLIAEAETGTGKTLAYLIPGILAAVRRGHRLLVSTHTRVLQDQAAEGAVKDAVACIAKLLPTERTPTHVLLKGASNYFCLQSFFTAFANPQFWHGESSLDPAGGVIRSGLLSALLFAKRGELAPSPPTIPLKKEEQNLDPLGKEWLALKGDSMSVDRCNHRRPAVSGLPQCPVGRAREAARLADVVFCNHAWLMAHGPSKGDLVVLDEAELLPRAAEGHYLQELRGKALSNLAKGLDAPDQGILDRSVALFSEDQTRTLVGRVRVLAREIRSSAEELTQDIQDLSSRISSSQNNRRSSETEFARGRVVGSGAEKRISSRIDSLVDAAKEASGNLEKIASMEPVAKGARVGQKMVSYERDLGEISKNLAKIGELGSLWPRPGSPPNKNWFFSFSVDGLRARPRIAGPQLVEVFEEAGALVFCSAAVGLEGDTGVFEVRTGAGEMAKVREAQLKKLRLESPFDYGSQLVVAVAADAPNPRLEREVWMDWLKHRVIEAAERTQGRMLCLVTSKEDMKALAGALRPRLSKVGVQVYEGWGETAAEVTRRFRLEEHSVIVGVDSFWYGVDFPGRTLEWVLIAKLPFDPRDEFRVAHNDAVATELRLDEGKGIYVPDAMLKLRQGIGRAIRTTSDRGTILLCDSRVLKPDYKQVFKKALPSGQLGEEGAPSRPRLVVKSYNSVLREALERHGLRTEIESRGLSLPGKVPTRAPSRASPSNQTPPPAKPQVAVASSQEPADPLLVAEKAFQNEDFEKARQVLEPVLAGKSTAGPGERNRAALLRARLALDSAEDGCENLLGRLVGMIQPESRAAFCRMRIEAVVPRDEHGEALTPRIAWKSNSIADLPASTITELLDDAGEAAEDPVCAEWRSLAVWVSRDGPPEASPAIVSWESDARYEFAAYIEVVACLRGGALEHLPAEVLGRIPKLVAKFSCEQGLPPPRDCLAPVLEGLLSIPSTKLDNPLPLADAILTGIEGDLLHTGEDGSFRFLEELGLEEGLRLAEALCEVVGEEAQRGEPRREIRSNSAFAKSHNMLRALIAHLELDTSVARSDSRKGFDLILRHFEHAAHASPRDFHEVMDLASSFADQFTEFKRMASRLQELVADEAGLAANTVVRLGFLLARFALIDGDVDRAQASLERLWQLAAADQAGGAALAHEIIGFAESLEFPDPIVHQFQEKLAQRWPSVQDASEAEPVQLDGDLLIVGGNDRLRAKVLDSVPEQLRKAITWVVSEHGQRAKYQKLEAKLGSSKVVRTVLITDYVSHSVSNKVTAEARAREEGWIRFPERGTPAAVRKAILAA